MCCVTADKVADYLLQLAHYRQWCTNDNGDLLTNSKLQVLVYYAQAWYLALYDEPLFQEHFEAWVSGPVQPALYQKFKHHEWNPITHNPAWPKLPAQVREHLGAIVLVFGDHTGYVLERIVRNETPWCNARGELAPDEACYEIISEKDMSTYYKRLMASRDVAGA